MAIISTKEKLIEILASGEFVSGEKMSQTLNCSRTAIWKHIKQLQNEGYEIEAITHKGYRIVSVPDRVSSKEIVAGLQTKIFGRKIHYFETVESTQIIAKQLAHDGAIEGTVIVAEQQTNGRGRLGNQWYSPAQTGIWLSMIIRPTISPRFAGQLTLVTAVAVVQAIEAIGIKSTIKWPNDILLNEKKIVGILTEMQSDMDEIQYCIIGVGINVNEQNFSLPTATSLFLETNEFVNRAKLVQQFLLQFEMLYENFLLNGFMPIKLRWEQHCNTIGKIVKARMAKETLTGLAIGMNDDGALLLKTDDGEIHTIFSAYIEDF